MNTGPVKFLLVDDSEENLTALEALLRRDGLEILVARSGTDALELLLIHEVALAVLDVQMPEMDGFELAELMRGSQRTRHIPIVFLTAGGLDDRRRFRGYEAGAVDFLFKPVEPHVLKGKADVFFELHRQKQELAASALELRKLNEELEQRVAERTEELLAANQEMEAFTYSVAHDLRAPLRAITSTSRILIDELGPNIAEDHQALLNRQAFNSAKLAALIDDLLRLSRISRQDVVATEVDISEMAKAAAEDAGVSDRVEIVPGITMCGDASLLRIAVQNLLDNAVKYSPDGGKILVAPLHCEGMDGFSIQDQGIGFDMRYLTKIFKPFERLHRDEEFPGSGVGLASVKRIMERHHGRLWAESELGKGATFFVACPSR